MRAVSLFSGIGALDLAVAEVFGAHPVAFAELDPNASKVLAARWPGVPNVGDVTAADWSAFEDVEVVHGGPPCQPFSAAGRRGGMADERWMWPAMERAVRMVRPRYVVVENVPPLVASDAWGVIVSDLAEIGYVGSWLCLRASDVGACHRRERVFLLATDASGAGRSEAAGRAPAKEGGERSGRGHHVAHGVVAPVRNDGRVVEQAAADANEFGWRGGPAVPGGLLLADRSEGRRDEGVRAGGLRGGAPATDADCGRLEGGVQHDGGTVGPRLEAPRRDDADGRRAAAPDAADCLHGNGRGGVAPPPPSGERGGAGDGGRSAPSGGGSAWGDYAPAIARHARLAGRPSPAPVDERGRLSAHLVEWMMCLPAGWVTDVLPRNPALKALGNAVVAPCAVAALRLLRTRLETGVAA